jgi:tetratricopeptide (TPR) repeat protein
MFLAAQARYSEALEVLDTAVAVVGPHPQILLVYGLMLTATGDTAGAVALYDELIRRKDGEYISSTTLAGLGALIGRNDEAWEWFEMAFEERDPVFPSYLRRYEEGAPPDLIDDPRWNALRRRLGMR